MIHWLIPTQQNNFRAKLLSIPALTLIMLGLLILNSITGFTPIRSIEAAVSVDQIIASHNAERSKAGLEALKYSSVLSNSAQRKAEAMLAADCWSHYCPAGKSPWEFFTESGYQYLYAGENLAEGFYNIDSLMVAWMNSPTHRDNILRANYTEVGIGIVNGTFQGNANSTVIAVHFGTPASSLIQAISPEEISSIDAPKITFPQDGSAFNSSELQIKGQADKNANDVKIYNNNQPWALVSANQGIFTYNAELLEQGTYKLQAQATRGSIQSNLSKPVNFTIDTEPNPVKLSQLTFLNTRSSNTLNMQVNQAGVAGIQMILENGETKDFQKASDLLWELELPRNFIGSGFQLATVDVAGNEWIGQFSNAQILAELSINMSDLNSTATTQQQPTEVLRSQINGTVLIFLIIMFVIDLVVLNRTGQTKSGGRTNLHVALLLIVGIVILTGTFIGQVGQGIST